MKACKRREEIPELIGSCENPVSANALAERFGVSRQVIVKDIAVLREGGHCIVATNRGYVLGAGRPFRVFSCKHGIEEIAAECADIVEAGGVVGDVFVIHPLYGRICVKLDICSVAAADKYFSGICSGKVKPLMSLTDGYHFHTVYADSEDTLDKIEDALRSDGLLAE